MYFTCISLIRVKYIDFCLLKGVDVKLIFIMKKFFLILVAVICFGVGINAQAYQQLNIESDASRYNRELEILKLKQEIERIKQENTSNQDTQGNTIVNPNANVLQKRSYSDGKALVYIENKSNSYRSNCRGERKADELKIENISGQTITVKYCFRAVLYNCDDNFVQEQTTYREKTLRPGEKTSESGYLSNGMVGYYYVDSFSVIYTQY